MIKKKSRNIQTFVTYFDNKTISTVKKIVFYTQ